MNLRAGWLAAAVLFAGCAGSVRLYNGPERKAEDIAVVEACAVEIVAPLDNVSRVFFSPGGKVTLTGMDDRKFRARRAEAEPGIRKISVNYRRDKWRSDNTIKVPLEAGKSYRIVAAEYSGGIIMFWAEEAGTRRVVAGIRHSMLDP